MNMGECVYEHVYIGIPQPHFNLTTASVQDRVCVNIKLPRSADSEEVFTACGRRFCCIQENRGKQNEETRR